MAMLVDNEKMLNAITSIETISGEFKTKGSGFISELTSALSTFEGDTKDALMEKKIGASGSEVDGTLAYFVEKQIPDLVKGLKELLSKNRDVIDESDQKLADAIRTGGQG